MRKVLQIAGIVMLSCNLQAQAILEWAFTAGGIGEMYAIDQIYHIDTDADGNILVTGFFTDSVDFDPGPGVSIQFDQEGDEAAFIAKYSPEMELIFVNILSGGTSSGTHFNFDSEGNILWTGWIYQTVDFLPGPGTFNLSSQGSTDYFLAKYTASGEFLWAVSGGGFNSEKGNNLVIQENDGILLTGNFEMTADFDPSPDEFELTAEEGFDLFFTRFDKNGHFIDARSLNAGPAYDNFDYSVTTISDSDGNIYTAGRFSQDCDFDMGEGEYELSGVSASMFFAKYDAALNLQWAKQITGDGSGTREIHGIALDNSGNIYLCGWYEGDIDVDPSENDFILEHVNETADDIFFAKYSNNGELIWAKSIGGEGYDYARNINIDNYGNILLTGDFYEGIDFDPGEGEAFIAAPANEDIFIALYDANGNYLNASSIAGSDYSYQYGFSAAVSANDDIYVGGYFSQTVDFDCTPGQFELTSQGDYDFFLAKYDRIEFEPVQVENNLPGNLTIYPNPVRQSLAVELPGQANGDIIIAITDISGSIIKTSATPLLDVRDLASGIYFLSLTSSSKTYTTSFIKL